MSSHVLDEIRMVYFYSKCDLTHDAISLTSNLFRSYVKEMALPFNLCLLSYFTINCLVIVYNHLLFIIKR